MAIEPNFCVVKYDCSQAIRKKIVIIGKKPVSLYPTFPYFFIFAENQDFFAYPITKPPAGTLKLKNLDSILQKLSVTPDKNWECAPTQRVPPVPGQAYGMR